jgi:xanthine dehydrogenase accessory factor
MKELLTAMKTALLKKEALVLAVITASSGSTPRGVGAKMLIGEKGRIRGTIGGAVPEHLAIEEGKKLIAGKRSAVRDYILHPNEAADIGAKCGGELRVFLKYIDPEDSRILSLIEAGLDCIESGKLSWLIMDTDGAGGVDGGSAVGTLGIADENGIIVWVGGSSYPEFKSLMGTHAALTELDGRIWFTDPLLPSGLVYVFGGGHVAQETVPLLAHLGFRCVVFDDREEFTRREIFPAAEKTITGNFDNIAIDISITENDYIVILTRGHLFDFQAEAFALGTKACYIGVIGSRTKLKFVSEKLEALGFTADAIKAERIHAPIGIDIESNTPAEIAVSIAAELILIRAKRDGGIRG